MADNSAAVDTVAAIATPAGQGGIGIIRLSGPAAARIGREICGGALTARYAHFRPFRDNDDVLDSGIVLYFPAPHSFTGEDVVELHGHGGPAVLELLLAHCCRLGARLAEAGEFSQRAFLNGKIDLTQAEAIADLIAATTEAGVRSANRSLQGEFSHRVETLMESIVSLRVFVEAAIDFPEEEVDFIEQGQVLDRLTAIRAQLDEIFQHAKQGKILRDGMKLVIAGRPNAGKSSLLNALSGEDTAIVTPVEGTTRDVLREHIQLDGMPLHIVDTAGLRDSPDLVEREGINRAWREIESADHILLVVDDSVTSDREGDADALWPALNKRLTRQIPVTIVHNKCDITGARPAIVPLSANAVETAVVTLSAKTGAGLDLLRQHLKHAMGYHGQSEHGFMARRRHIDALVRARESLQEGMDQLSSSGAGELLAEDLRRCHNCLGEITGVMTPDQLLGEIFSSFCIGK